MQKGVKFRIYPNKEQQNLINQTLGCCRFVYNLGLDMRNKAFENGEKIGYMQTSAMLTKLKRSDEFSFLRDADSVALHFVGSNPTLPTNYRAIKWLYFCKRKENIMVKIKTNDKGYIVVTDNDKPVKKDDAIKVIGNILDNCVDQKERDFLGDCLVRINNGQYFEGEI